MNAHLAEGVKWYREPWAWFIFMPLVLMVLICMALLQVSFRWADDVVIDDYYKQGRMINQRLDAVEMAKTLGINGSLEVLPEQGLVELQLSANPGYVFPETILFEIGHPIEEDLDRHVQLSAVEPGAYIGDFPKDINGRYYVRLLSPIQVDGHAEWRVDAEMVFGMQNKLQVRAGE